MSGNLPSVSIEDQVPDSQGALPDSADLSNALDHCPMQHENEVEEENKQEDGSGNEEEDEDEDADFNPFLKDTNSAEASSSLSSEVEDLDTDVAESSGIPPTALNKKSEEIGRDGTKDCRTSENIEHGEEIVMQTTVSSGEACRAKEKEPLPQTQSENGYPFDKENGLTTITDVNNTTEFRKPRADLDTEGAICMRTRARYSLASFSLDQLETFLQETDDEDNLQNVDDEEEYRKFLAAVLRGDDSQNLEESTNVDDEDEENDADFELELEEALESEPEEIEERRVTRRNRRQKASLEHSKRFSGQSNRPLRPLVPFASVGSFSTFDGKNLTPNIAPSYMPPANSGFTPDQIGQLHCLIHEHVQLLIQVFSLCVLEPAKRRIASEVKELVLEMLQKRDQVLSWRTVPYPSFCFFPPYVRPSVSAELQKTLPPIGNDKNVQQIIHSGGNRELHSDIISLSNERHKNLPDGQAGSSQTLESTSWVPYICGPVLSVTDVAPLRLVESYIEDVSSAVREYERYHIEIGFETHCQKEPLFALHNSSCSADSDGQGEAENPLPDSSVMLSSSSSNQMPKKTMAATLLEKAKSQSVALVPKEIAKLAQRFWPLFNPAFYPHKPPPAPLANRVLFTDAEDELLALGLMEYNTDWKAIQQRFLPCKSRHQIFVRQKNRASSKAPENPIKAVRRMKNSPLTPEEITRIEVGLKRFKLDWISIWRCFVPHRDPSLLPRQWRIASGTQKSYKSDATKKAKRRLYELRRKNCRPSPSTWHSSSEKEGDSTDNAVEETNSGDNRMDKEDEAYVHEAFLADWRPGNATTSNLPTLLHNQEASQGRDQNDNSGCGIFQPQMTSKPPVSLRLPSSEVVLRPYRARKPNSARLVKLAPDLPPVNLPPSVRIMSQSAFKSSTVITSSINPGNASVTPGIAIANRSLHSRSTIKSGAGPSVNCRPNGNNSVKINGSSLRPNLSEVTIDKSLAERGDSDLQMHPLLFQAPQDGHSPYYPVSCNTSSSSSFTFFSGKQPQLSLGLFHNPRHIRDAVNFRSKSSKPPEINAPSSSSPYGVDFHPLLQRTYDVDLDPTSAQLAARRRNAESKKQKAASISGRGNELDLDIHLSFTSKNQESRDMALVQGTDPLLSASISEAVESERANNSSKKRDSATDRISWKASENEHDESLPEIIMEQEELSDSEEDLGENVEFECEEMADSEGDSTSDSEQFVNIPDEDVQDGADADVDNARVLTTTSNYGDSSANRPLNLNSCPPVSPHPPNIKNTVAGYEFGPFGTTGTFSPNNHPASSKKSSSRHATSPRNPRKRVCRSNSNSSVGGSGKGNSSPNMDINVEKSNNVGTDEFCFTDAHL